MPRTCLKGGVEKTVSVCILHVVTGANKRQLYLQASFDLMPDFPFFAKGLETALYWTSIYCMELSVLTSLSKELCHFIFKVIFLKYKVRFKNELTTAF